MQADYSRIWPLLLAVIAAALIYRRLRRSVGRQRLAPVRIGMRIALLTLLGASMLPPALRSGPFLAAEAAGLAAGVLLAVWGSRRTRFETSAGSLYYVPHTYTGIAVSLLFMGRLVYRLVELRQRGGFDHTGPAAMVHSPVTAALLFVVIGYYVCYYSWVLWKSRHVRPQDLEASAPIA
jgi:hypothetical protein